MYQNGILMLSQKLQKTSTCFWFGSRGRNHVDSCSICFNVTTALKKEKISKKKFFFFLSLSLFTLLCAKTKTTHKVPLICQVISRYHFSGVWFPRNCLEQNHGTVRRPIHFLQPVSAPSLFYIFFLPVVCFPFPLKKRVLSASSFMGIFFFTFILLQHCLNYQHFYFVHWGFELKRSWNLGDI